MPRSTHLTSHLTDRELHQRFRAAANPVVGIGVAYVLRSGIVSSALRMGMQALRRLTNAQAYLTQAQRWYMSEPHWYDQRPGSSWK